MRYIYKGMAAGLLAATVLAVLLKLSIGSGFMPELDFISLIGAVTGIGTVGGWVIHFILGASIGGLFAWLDPDLPGDSLRQRGMILASAFWFVMMALLMPLGGMGFFGLDYGPLLPIATLALHLIFGAVLGGAYAWLLLQSVPLRYRQPRET